MEWTHVFAFNAALLAAMAAPGPALLFALRQSISGGFAKGLSTGMGLAFAATFWTAAALLGLEVVFILFPSTYLVMKFVGAAYLIRVAYVLWRDAKSPISESITSHGRAFRDGLLVNLSNPKSVLFSASVLVVIFPSGLVIWEKAAIVLNHLMVEMLVYTLFAALLSSAPARHGYLAMKPAIDRVSSLLLGALGLRLLLAK
jgi:threonine/homoserine/homoserine lactone efflux protein